MTENKENYIKAIFEFQENNITLTNKILADKLKVSPASASQMITKLINDDYVLDNSKEIKLSESAIVLAKVLISKHRLWESFLLRHFHYSSTEVHNDAEVLEHVTSELLLVRLNEFLDYPKRCPHGGIIYLNDDLSDVNCLLLDASVDDKIKIKRLIDNPVLINFMRDLNIYINDEALITNKDQLNENIYLQVNDKEIIISYKVAQQIYIEFI